MSSLSKKDRASLCLFTFSDGRRCRTPRTGNHPHFCFYHAQKEARARAAEKLSKELTYFFSGDYLSACDLSTALARLIPAVLRGDIKPKTAHTVAYLAQTLMQSIHISQDEYINAFGSDGWRNAVRHSVNGNRDYLFPPAPQPPPNQPPQPAEASQPAQTPVNCRSPLATHHSPLPQPQPASPHTPLPPTSAEFVQQVVARLQAGGGQTQQPVPASSPTSAPASPATPPQPAGTPVNGHSERSEEFAFSSNSSLGTHHSPLPQAEQPASQPAETPVNSSLATSHSPLPSRPSTPPPTANRDARAIHFDHSCRLRIDGKPF
jgi:hypothetical protein